MGKREESHVQSTEAPSPISTAATSTSHGMASALKTRTEPKSSPSQETRIKPKSRDANWSYYAIASTNPHSMRMGTRQRAEHTAWMACVRWDGAEIWFKMMSKLLYTSNEATKLR